MRIAVIGGGWSGLYALKSGREQGLDAILFEQSDRIGGVWKYDEESPGGVYRSSHATASKTYLHASDFPMPDDFPEFPHHSEILQFLESYADHFSLWPHIRTNHSIERISKDGDVWQVSVIGEAKSETMEFDGLMICTGQHQNPYYPAEPYFNDFSGLTLHSNDYKYPTDDLKDKVVLIVGGGESASDIAVELCNWSKHVYMSIRNGQWFQDRLLGANQPTDQATTTIIHFWFGDSNRNPFTWVGRKLFTEPLWGRGGTGIPEWQPKVGYLRQFFNKSRAVVEKVGLGMVTPKRGICNISGNEVWFEGDDDPVHVDVMILATGFRSNIEELITEDASSGLRYKYVFDPHDPSLTFIGSVRPVFGSIPALAELQARWAAAVFAGKAKLPSKRQMLEEIERDRKRHSKYYTIDDERLPQLVVHATYAKDIAGRFGIRPNLLKWFFRSPRKWWTILNATWVPALYQLEDPEKREAAYQQVKAYVPRKHTLLHAQNRLISLTILGVFLNIAVLAGLIVSGMSITRALQIMAPLLICVPVATLFGPLLLTRLEPPRVEATKRPTSS